MCLKLGLQFKLALPWKHPIRFFFFRAKPTNSVRSQARLLPHLHIAILQWHSVRSLCHWGPLLFHVNSELLLQFSPLQYQYHSLAATGLFYLPCTKRQISHNSASCLSQPTCWIFISVDKKNQLDVTFCILYFSSNSCSTCFEQPRAHHQELTTAWCYSLVLVCAVGAGRWSSPVGR